MNRITMALIAALLLSSTTGLQAVEKKAKAGNRFFGKITAIDVQSKTVTVHNQKNKKDRVFNWNDETAITLRKQPMQPSELAVGQSLIVSYKKEGEGYVARKITVREPTSFAKKELN
jgi:acyl CoA:acetate/3-ketoacid CoA transferase alpha subunit